MSNASTVWRQVATATGGYGRPVAIRCQAVDGGARKASTVWRQVATATGGYVRPVAIRCQAVDGGARKASTAWRQVATAVWRQVATATRGYGRLATGGYVRLEFAEGSEPVPFDHWQQCAPLAVSFATFAPLR